MTSTTATRESVTALIEDYRRAVAAGDDTARDIAAHEIAGHNDMIVWALKDETMATRKLATLSDTDKSAREYRAVLANALQIIADELDSLAATTDTATTARKWTLVTVTTSRNATPCDHCERDVKRGFVVADAEGRQMRVGRGCVKKLTGWTLEALAANTYAERRALVLAEFPTLTEAQAGDVAAHDFNWRTDGWRNHATNHARMNARQGR